MADVDMDDNDAEDQEDIISVGDDDSFYYEADIEDSCTKPPVKVKVFVCFRGGNQQVEEAVRRIENAVEYVCNKTTEMFLEENEPMFCRNFEISSQLANISSEQEAMNIKGNEPVAVNMFFFCGDYETKKGYNISLDCFFEIPLDELADVPTNLSEELTRAERDAFGMLVGYVSHELYHAMGAFHSSNGIMSGRLNILENPETTLESVRFKDIIDFITVRIIIEVLSKVNADLLNCQLYKNRAGTHVGYNSFDKRINMFCFISRGIYSNCFRLFESSDNTSDFRVRFPPNSDGLVVLHYDGPYTYYSRDSPHEILFTCHRKPF